jgi:hypothetical protein
MVGQEHQVLFLALPLTMLAAAVVVRLVDQVVQGVLVVVAQAEVVVLERQEQQIQVVVEVAAAVLL